MKTVKNKILQKQYYQRYEIPTAEFVITKNLQELDSRKNFLPAVHKLGEGGYDGRGVQVLETIEDVGKGFDKPSVLEKLVNIHKEIALIVAAVAYAAAVVWAVGAGANWGVALLVAAIANIAVAVGLGFWAKSQIPDLLFAATLRQLRKDAPDLENEHAPDRSVA